MKYIRLKNGRIVDQYQTVRPQSVVKRADTIEELCDEFVYKKGKAELCINKKDTYLSSVLVDIDDATPFYTRMWIYLKDLTEPLYGAIWTDKGLIYVAKMNDKGELELL